MGFFAYAGPKNPYSVPLTIGELAELPNIKYSPREILEEVFARLAAYEDTGYAPGQFEDAMDAIKAHLWDVEQELRAYKDTGLEPEQIEHIKNTLIGKSIAEINEFDGIPTQRLQELVKAEKDGRLVVLPCKVGDKVWTNLAMSGWYLRDKDRPYSARVVFVGLNDSDKMGRGLINVVYGKHDNMMQFSFSEIGKTVFLTEEEAEGALGKEAQ